MSPSSDIFTFDTLLKFVEPLTEKDHCRELIDYFDVPAEESKVIIESDAPFCSLSRYLREEGMVSVDAFSRLMIACSDKGLRKSRAVEQLTQLTLDVFKDQRGPIEKRTQELTDKY
ncbi:hypothetical protein BSL78_18541 [Apostichopus japonicus]|uniref:Uncharacterized protein n=1 Tax=Stichopus japonicus TaxID=307972 RepID=A0A2G8K9G6_STIJA|nr:hypothetical protein BSL78_18541 [Apostichopus japonicus]